MELQAALGPTGRSAAGGTLEEAAAMINVARQAIGAQRPAGQATATWIGSIGARLPEP